MPGSERRRSQESECCAHAEGTRFYCIDGQVRNCCTLQARIVSRALRLRSIFLRIVRASRSAGGVRNSIKLTGGNLGGLTSHSPSFLLFNHRRNQGLKLAPGNSTFLGSFRPLSITSLHCGGTHSQPLHFPSNEIQKPIQPAGCELSPCTSPSLDHGSTIILIVALL